MSLVKKLGLKPVNCDVDLLDKAFNETIDNPAISEFLVTEIVNRYLQLKISRDGRL